MKYVHQQGLCHRDLRVENIMIDDEYHIKIIDFGHAEEKEPKGLNNIMFCSLRYAAPEILN